jgi:hypothetical protein
VRLKEFWNRLTGGDKLERVEEEMEQDRVEEPAPVDDYEEIREDVPLRSKIFRV